MDMRKRAGGRNWKRRSDTRRMLSVLACILLPPLGIYMVWRSRWSARARYCLTGLAVACFALMVVLLPSADGRADGGIELVGRERQAEIYGPDLPTATVTGYVAPVSQSVFAADEDETVIYVYATTSGTCYHLADCKYTYESSQKMTPYEAYFLGYLPCTECGAPAYVPGSMN